MTAHGSLRLYHSSRGGWVRHFSPPRSCWVTCRSWWSIDRARPS